MMLVVMGRPASPVRKNLAFVGAGRGRGGDVCMVLRSGRVARGRRFADASRRWKGQRATWLLCDNSRSGRPRMFLLMARRPVSWFFLRRTGAAVESSRVEKSFTPLIYHTIDPTPPNAAVLICDALPSIFLQSGALSLTKAHLGEVPARLSQSIPVLSAASNFHVPAPFYLRPRPWPFPRCYWPL